MANPDNEPNRCDFAFSDADIDRLSSRSVTDQADLLSTIGNETRYRILIFLTEADAPVCGCELEPHFDVGQSSISQSLTRLRKVGLVTSPSAQVETGRLNAYGPRISLWL